MLLIYIQNILFVLEKYMLSRFQIKMYIQWTSEKKSANKMVLVM